MSAFVIDITGNSIERGNAKMTIAISSLQSSRMTLGTCSDELVKRRFDRPYPIAGVTMADISLLMNGGFAELKEQAHGLQKPSLDPLAFRGRARNFQPHGGKYRVPEAHWPVCFFIRVDHGIDGQWCSSL